MLSEEVFHLKQANRKLPSTLGINTLSPYEHCINASDVAMLGSKVITDRTLAGAP